MPEEVREYLQLFHNDILNHCGQSQTLCRHILRYNRCDPELIHIHSSPSESLNGYVLISGVHLEEEEEEEEVDTTVRGRLLKLVEKVKNLRKKQEEEEPEPEEEPKPSE